MFRIGISQDGEYIRGYQAGVGGNKYIKSHASVLFTWVNPMKFDIYFNKAVTRFFFN